MPKKIKIVIIGAGNVGFHLAMALKKNGHTILQVISRSYGPALELARLTDSEAENDFSRIRTDADLYIIAVKDDDIVKVAEKLPSLNVTIVHTSGSASPETLSRISSNYGVFYPLQSFKKNTPVDLSHVPFCLEASNEHTMFILKELASDITDNIHEIDEQKRKKIHLAAVFACNFSNYLYTVSENILKEEKLDLSILYPLIEETAKRIKHNSPAILQTGPAARRDFKTIQQHKSMLNDKKYLELYTLLTENILNSLP
jgi:predicted short-subunit dehydrogenase-like oxidoreductase (DUF2520 family)